MSIGGGKTNPTNPTTPGYNVGESFSNQSAGSSSSSTNLNYGSNVWNPQQGYLRGGWGDALRQSQNTQNQNLASSLLGQGVGAANQALNPFFLDSARWGMNRGTEYINAGNRNTDRAMRSFQSFQNPGKNPALDMYSRQIGQNFREQIMPELRGTANQFMGRGSSRQGIAEGLAAARAGQQIQDFGAQVYNQDMDRKLSAGQNMLGAGQNYFNAAQGRLGLGELGANIFGEAAQALPQFAQMGLQIPWYNLQQRMGLIGSPILQDLGGKSTSSSSSHSSGKSYSYNVGKTASGGGGGGGWNLGADISKKPYF